VVFHYRPGRKGEYAAEILEGFNGTIQVDAYGGYTHLATAKRTGGDPLWLALAIVLGPMADNGSFYKIEDAIRGSDPDHRRAVRQELSRPLVDAFFTWLQAQAARVSRKSDLGVAMAYMLKRQDGFRVSRALRGPTGATVPFNSLTTGASTSTPISSKTPSAARP
jgi:transposase